MKKGKKSVFIKATSHFHSRQFKAVIRLLEPEIFNYRENFLFYYMLGLSCLYQNDLESADSYLKRANQIEESNLAVLLGLAYINVSRGKFDAALNLYLDILDLDTRNRIAKEGLDFIRKSVIFKTDINIKKIERLLPVIRKKGKKKKLLLLFLLIPAVALYWLLLYGLPVQNQRPGLEKYAIPENKVRLIDFGDDSLFPLSEAQIKKSFNLAKKHFNQYRDNLAMVEINRLLNSNATDEIKSIVYMLKDYARQPDFSNLQDNFSFSRVQTEPILYRNCFVIWAGRVGELVVSESVIQFDLWVGNETKFEGVVPVVLDFAYNLTNGKQIEVLGRILYEDDILLLKGITIHDLFSE